jgi:hypothetical protein
LLQLIRDSNEEAANSTFQGDVTRRFRQDNTVPNWGGDLSNDRLAAWVCCICFPDDRYRYVEDGAGKSVLGAVAEQPANTGACTSPIPFGQRCPKLHAAQFQAYLEGLATTRPPETFGRLRTSTLRGVLVQLGRSAFFAFAFPCLVFCGSLVHLSTRPDAGQRWEQKLVVCLSLLASLHVAPPATTSLPTAGCQTRSPLSLIINSHPHSRSLLDAKHPHFTRHQRLLWYSHNG